jgi:hypothetical protein
LIQHNLIEISSEHVIIAVRHGEVTAAIRSQKCLGRKVGSPPISVPERLDLGDVVGESSGDGDYATSAGPVGEAGAA